MSDAFFGKMSSMKGSRAGYCVRMAARIDRCSDERTADDVLMCSSLLYLRNMTSCTKSMAGPTPIRSDKKEAAAAILGQEILRTHTAAGGLLQLSIRTNSLHKTPVRRPSTMASPPISKGQPHAPLPSRHE